MVQAIGGAAGLAAVVGLVVLCALHLSQAREVKRLREWAGRAPEHAARAVPQQTVTIPPRRSPPRHLRLGARSVAIALVGLFVVGGATYGVTQLTGDDGGDTSPNAQASSDLRKKATSDSATVEPGNVTVAVLNGTTVPGLAAMLRDQIGAVGFRKGTVNDFSDQQLAESVVQYAPGHQAAANAVGRTVGISQREPVTPNARSLAGEATVIVIAGADKAP